MDSYKKSKLSFLLNTKDLCFFCLEEIPNDCTATDTHPQSKICFFDLLSRYLAINFLKVLQTTSMSVREDGIFGKTDVLVSLCGSCSLNFDKFSSLYEEFEIIQMRLTNCIKIIHDKISKGRSDMRRMEEYKNRMSDRTNNLQDLLEAEIVEKLRDETVNKCASLIEKRQPRIKLEKVEDELVNELKSEPEHCTGSTEEDLSFGFSSNNPTNYAENMDDSSDDLGNNTFSSLNDTVVDRHELEEDSMDQSNSEGEAESESEMDQVQKEVEITQKKIKSKSPCIKGPKGRKLHHCDTCNKYVTQLGTHLRTHSTNRQHKCKYCNKSLRTAITLRRHTITQHYEESFMSLKDPDFPIELFKAGVDIQLQSCQIDQKLLINDNRRIKQMYKCRFCNYNSYSYQWSLRIHLIQIHYDVLRTKILEMQKNPEMAELKRHATQSQYAFAHLRHGLSDNKMKIKDLKDTGVCPYLLGNKRKQLGLSSGSPVLTTKCSKCGLTLPTREAWIRHTRLECKQNEFISSEPAMTPPVRSFWNFSKGTRIRCNNCKKSFLDYDSLKKHTSIQHPPESVESFNNDFECEHCIKKFRFFFSYRIHLLTIHRDQVLSGYAPQGTKPKEISEAIKTVLQNFEKMPNDGKKCKRCKKEFKQKLEVENHMVVVHFDEVVEELKGIFGCPEEPNISPENSATPRGTDASGSDVIVEEENVDKDAVPCTVIKNEECNASGDFNEESVKPEMSDPLFILP